MESEFTLTTDEIWKNVIRSVESAYCWLLTYEGKDYELINDSIAAMRKLITHGKTYEAMKSFNSAKFLNQPTPKNIPYKKHHFTPMPISYDLESNWQQLDEHTIQVNLEGGEKALAIAVTNEQQLDQVIRDIYNAECVAVDCEFLGQKKALPELKLLQIGVSKEKGYAIQVDVIGRQVIADKLKPILEDQDLNIVGWSFRGDALAIESYMNGIELAPVLDLQAKIRPVAVENLNLSNALNGYASEWVGNNEFQKAKQYGSQFFFTGRDCIWLINPLPPKALVYAVFDVLSVVALYEHTLQYPSDENHYWPYTITSTATQKSLDKWHVQRAKGNNTSSNQGVVNIVNPKPLPKSKNGKEKETILSASIIPTPQDDGYDDEDVRFQRALQVALERSVKDNFARAKTGESSDRVVDSKESEKINYNVIAQELEANPYNCNKNDLRFSDAPVEEPSAPDIVESTWGNESLDDQPFFGGVFNRPKKTTSEASPPQNITILKRPTAPEIAKSDLTTPQKTKTFNQSPRDSHLSPNVINRQWQIETVPVPVESAASKARKNETVVAESSPTQRKSHSYSQTLVSPANKSRGADNSKKGQWNINATSKHHWNVSDHESSGQKNDYSLNKSWSKASSTTNNWGEATGNNQWNNKSTGSASQWGDSTSKQRNTVSSLSPRVSETQITPSASRSVTKASPSLSEKTRSPQSQNASCKPDKNKYTNDLKNRIHTGNQTGSFTTWAPSTKNEMSSASWKSFVNSSIKDWEEGKDTTLDAIEEPIENASPTPEPIMFNTTAQSHYPRGGDVGDSSTGKMIAGDSWSRQEDRPDTMQMPMNQIPIRTKFHGPKVTNPNDEMDDNDYDDYEYNGHAYTDSDFPILKMNMAIQDKSQTRKIEPTEYLPTFVDGIFLYSEDGDGELSMYILTKPEHLDMIHMPRLGTDFTATICYHFITVNNKRILKALQIYLSTGDSYTAIIEKTFRMKRPGTLQKTKFGKLLTDPSIKRICWAPSYIEEEMENALGFKIGPCVDLMNRANYDREQNCFSFIEAIDFFLTDWQDKQQYMDAKADYEAIIAKKFSSTCWDREKLPDAVLTYSALQGLTAYTLYQDTIQRIDAPDSNFMYEP